MIFLSHGYYLINLVFKSEIISYIIQKHYCSFFIVEQVTLLYHENQFYFSLHS